jgi:hypothetical protein
VAFEPFMKYISLVHYNASEYITHWEINNWGLCMCLCNFQSRWSSSHTQGNDNSSSVVLCCCILPGRLRLRVRSKSSRVHYSARGVHVCALLKVHIICASVLFLGQSSLFIYTGVLETSALLLPLLSSQQRVSAD